MAHLTQVSEEQQAPVMEAMLEEMRSIISCKICFRLLYEPYTISCGHTYCYSCLSQWFQNNSEGRKKTCPGCRAPVRRPPAPSFTIRELTQKFIAHPELLPDGETKGQHEEWSTQEAEAVDRDRAIGETTNEGVFPGVFPREDQRRPLPPIIDDDDGVERCPYCNWEIEEEGDPICPRCGERHALDDEDQSYNGEEHDVGFSDMESEDVDDEDDLDGGMDLPYGLRDGFPDYEAYDSEPSEEELHGPITHRYVHSRRPGIPYPHFSLPANTHVHGHQVPIDAELQRGTFDSDADDSEGDGTSLSGSQRPVEDEEQDGSDSDDGSSMEGFIDDAPEHYDDHNSGSDDADASDVSAEPDSTVQRRPYMSDSHECAISIDLISSDESRDDDDDDEGGAVSRPVRRR